MCDRNGNAVEWTKTVATNTSTNSSSCVNTNVNEKTIVKHPDVAIEKLDFPEDNIIEGRTASNTSAQLPKFMGIRSTFSQHVNMQQYEVSKLTTAAYADAELNSACADNTNLATESIKQNECGEKQTTANAEMASHIPGSVINTLNTANVSKKLESNSALHLRLMALGINVTDANKLDRIQQVVENAISHEARQQIVQILERISTLKPLEKLLLYLRLPGETSTDIDPLKQQQNPLGTRSEINHTINWVRTHLEQDPQVSIPKQDVYNDYVLYCERLDIKPLSTADFGKVMKQVFPGIRPRRLGTRGHSRYCYAAMRKASKLPAPHLPSLHTTTYLPSGGESKTNLNGSGKSIPTDRTDPSDPSDPTETQTKESWNIIKEWAEQLLHIKVDTLNGLAQHIKENANTSPVRSAHVNKKHSQREPKEKRLLADMGPLKKRRKKKRKESSSSESSSSHTFDKQRPQVIAEIASDVCKTKVCVNEKFECQPEVKQECLEPCGPDSTTTSSIINSFMANDYMKQMQHQIVPMNLAFVSKSQKVPGEESQADVELPLPSAPIDNMQSIKVPATTAVKDLGGKNSLSVAKPHSESAPPAHKIVKEEVPPDNYNISNVFCKKVLKAQQTKGYLNSSVKTLTPSASMSIITTSAVTPPPPSTPYVVTSTPHHIENAAIAINFTMGPPTMQNQSTFSPNHQQGQQEETTNCTQAKVLSRNFQQLRAKKLMNSNVTSSNDPSDLSVVKDADLPENLGLPRERVISICNMDKHELDDYFLPVEEDNSEDQESELLQYFQVGDAEKKSINNPTSDATTNHSSLPVTISTEKSIAVAVVTDAVPNSTLTQDTGKRQLVGISEVEIKFREDTLTNDLTATSLPSVTIRSASASLTHLSQKHQQQQRLLEHLSESHDDKLTIKRKLSNVNSSNATEIAACKNYSFLPISPNINNTEALNGRTATNSQLFVSPNQTRMLNKQQSLDCDSSDPMLGSARRKRSYFSLFSISAPPSPSILKQQQQKEQQPSASIKSTLTTNDWAAVSVCSNNLVHSCNHTAKITLSTISRAHNSLDIDQFGIPTYAVCRQDANLAAGLNTNSLSKVTNNRYQNLNEITQRSQSVPLSQLQRRQSPVYNQTFNLTTSGHESSIYSACTSLTQTPVPVDFSDSAIILSENSCSQQSTSIQLEEVGGGVVASDSTAILDDVDISEVLSSPDFITKFSNITESSAANIICPSAGSSSGYGSANNFVISSNNFCGSNSLSAVLSRSVPSTPLPLQNSTDLHKFGSNFSRRRFVNSHSLNGVADNVSAFNPYANSSVGITTDTYLTRSASDLSKSMPCTPITSVPSSFRYSPSEITNDFLINDNISTPFDAIADSLLTRDDDIIDDCSTKVINNQTILSDSSIVIGTDLLDNL